ncbi:hypothetical protein PHYBLDRAFT_174445 [Phycomyces blakesleeanus NRRL 1555(-)]|uniref:Uncharacterized protein n=1 Tax=Phycomyces blakesleeanus (strain ATCC 8743b / DSM 1359 / FGSC 10004 / NBRC 33097 / NRRL 1555) TaxID=763407 RepID=A0A167K789_PHYB8|nr:hypothetical protein PHYBLDRAFT_174445 [Phycomyces blakesleeanus NRRL 1555(-)]OAD67408.1 hypothetical protein PHYBLDRAFT_174445 [Phycomyces blakesleeanus NRRL 1555(-)]|eukprot:XP_018285448.1 hypothetical protein PHYBLDRAFT_174445 [Phycomyces blakesleeanus NRRL 1555(-)]
MTSALLTALNQKYINSARVRSKFFSLLPLSYTFRLVQKICIFFFFAFLLEYIYPSTLLAVTSVRVSVHGVFVPPYSFDGCIHTGICLFAELWGVSNRFLWWEYICTDIVLANRRSSRISSKPDLHGRFVSVVEKFPGQTYEWYCANALVLCLQWFAADCIAIFRSCTSVWQGGFSVRDATLVDTLESVACWKVRVGSCVRDAVAVSADTLEKASWLRFCLRGNTGVKSSQMGPHFFLDLQGDIARNAPLYIASIYTCAKCLAELVCRAFDAVAVANSYFRERWLVERV